ncbi:MAG TPA: ADOP family duplicated permease, partial [Bryobacteraceae bacterium]|nr:ADOP family duplicated permease [Bryobacteraceae bacterium]
SADLFPLLGVKPLLGRNILPEETRPGRDREIILSYGLWARRFQADPSVIGRKIQVNGHDCTIIGVMPREFDFPMRLATTVRTPSRHMDFWAPDGVDPAAMQRLPVSYGAVARLRPGVTLAQARQDLAGIAARLARVYPETNRGRMLRAAFLRDRTLGFAATGLLLLLGAAIVFLLIGCANVANLLLARALGRHREVAVRTALGAGRSRIVRQFLVESGILAAAGGLGGYGLAVLAWRFLPAITPMSIPRLASARADGEVLAFALAIAAMAGLLSGVAPAWRMAVQEPGAMLREAGMRGAAGAARNRLHTLLFVAEIAVTVVLVMIGGTLTGNFIRLARINPGFDAGQVLASIIVPAGDRYARHPENQAALFRGILDGVRRLPGIQAAGAVDALPFSGDNHGGRVAATDLEASHPDHQPIAEVDKVTAGYLEAMGVRLIAGRWFREDELDARYDVAIVNDLAAERLWPGGQAVGSRVCIDCRPGRPPNWKRVVGVVGSLRHAALDEPPGLEVYVAGGSLSAANFLVVRTGRHPAELIPAIRRVVAGVDPNQPVFLSATMSTLIGDSLSDRRFILTLLAITGLLALLLSAAGVYGVVSYVTSRRTRELGVRMALGATPGEVQALVFRHGMGRTALGIAIGLPAALALTRLLSHWTATTQTGDAPLIGLAVALVAVTAAIACWLPARRATRIDPMVVLREE